MSCGCGRPQRLITPAKSRGGGHGFYSLITYEDCTTAHTGEFAGLSIFVACPGDRVKERLFAWDDYQLAADYVIAERGQLDSVPTAHLCDQAVRAVYSPGG